MLIAGRFFSFACDPVPPEQNEFFTFLSLTANISFSPLPPQYYLPHGFPDITGLNKWVFLINHTIFSRVPNFFLLLTFSQSPFPPVSQVQTPQRHTLPANSRGLRAGVSPRRWLLGHLPQRRCPGRGRGLALPWSLLRWRGGWVIPPEFTPDWEFMGLWMNQFVWRWGNMHIMSQIFNLKIIRFESQATIFLLRPLCNHQFLSSIPPPQ